MTVLVAPDSFKGTFRSPEVAAAIGRGLVRAGFEPDLAPAADGGDGTLEVLLLALGGETDAATVKDPLGRPVTAGFGLLEDGAGAVVEMASASGLQLVEEEERDAEAASTFGTGELILAAVDAGADVVFVTVGGSATTDGGAGALQAIEEAGGLRGARLVVLCDVRTPFERAAEVFGPQKGADPAAVRRLTGRLHELAGGWPRDPRSRPMTGCAGGLSGGLWAALGAELVPGAAFVLDALRFDARLKEAGAVITGEGKLDEQTLQGKVVNEVATRARQRGVPCNAIVGKAELDRFGRRLLDLDNVVEATTLEEVDRAAEALGDRLPPLERRR
ncbi:MAG: glycerate kinase [Solirubrobacterales bacterium]